MGINEAYVGLGAGLRVGVSSTTCESHLTNGQRDGIGVYTDNLLSSLKKLERLDVSQFYYPSSVAGGAVANAKNESIQLRMPYLVSGFVSHALNLADINSNIIESRVDVYHCTDYKIPKLNNVPVVATLYDAIALKNPEWASDGFRSLKNSIMKNGARWLDHAITISNFAVDDVVEYWGVPEEKVSVVHCGVDNYWFQQQSDEVTDEVIFKYNIGKPYVLFVGTFQPRKNIDRVIDAFMSLPDVFRKEFQLVLVGKSGWRSESLLEKVEMLVDKGECIRIDSAIDSDVRCLYQRAKVFLFPSLYEGFGMPVLEAFASGVPVIASKGTALEEVAGGAAALVDPYSIDDMRDKLHDLLDADEVTISAMKANGFERALQFGWDKVAEKTYDVYKNII